MNAFKQLLQGAAGIERFLRPFTARDGRGEKLMRYLATSMMETLINAQREGKQSGFRIPLQLIRGWSLSD